MVCGFGSRFSGLGFEVEGLGELRVWGLPQGFSRLLDSECFGQPKNSETPNPRTLNRETL